MDKPNPFTGEVVAERPRRWWEFFRDETTDKKIDRAFQEARQAVEWMEMPYHDKFMDWLSDRIDEPVDMRDNAAIVSGTARMNTFKEVRKYLKDLRRRAEIAIGER